MNKKFSIIAAILTLITALLAITLGPAPFTSSAADHLDAPLVQKDGRIDINDLYAFTKGENTVLVMTVNPVAGALSPISLKPGAKYEFAIDNNGDAIEDIVYRLQASNINEETGTQNITLRQAGSSIIAKGQSESTISVDGGGQLFVGLRDDPFFFDLVGFQNGLAFCQTDPAPDFFAGFNVTAIVLEVPTASLLDGSSNIGVWARTTRNGNKVVERMGRPAINTVLIPASSKDAFNATTPANDVATWTDTVVSTLVSLNGDQGYSEAVASILLPDILTIDTSEPSSFLNGRGLTDDVIDIALTVVSNGGVNSDCVYGNDVPFLTSFPYLAQAH